MLTPWVRDFFAFIPHPSSLILWSMRILIIKPSSLGDIVHALPTIHRIRQRFPDARISWVVNDFLTSLLKNCPIIDERIPFQRHQYGTLQGPGDFADFLAMLQGRGFDLVLDLQGLLRSGLMTWSTLAPRRLGLSDAREGARLFYNEVVPVSRGHAVERYLCAARHLGCADGPIEFPLGSSNADQKYVDQLLAPLVSSLIPHPSSLVAINPSARWQTKLWGDDKFAELVRHLPWDRAVFTGSTADRERINVILSAIRSDSLRSTLHAPRNLAGQTDLSQLAELYRRCAVVITNDSGPMHIAAAVGTPVVAIFGPTDPALTGPYGEKHVVLRAGISCSPCLKDQCFHRPEMECMARVEVQQVLEAAERFLA